MPKDPFEYQRPTEPQVQHITDVRLACKAMATLLESTPMDGRCKAIAMTKLEELSMWANKGIVFAPDPTVPIAPQRPAAPAPAIFVGKIGLE